MSGDGAIYDDVAFELFAVAFIAAIWLPIAIFRLGRAVMSLRKKPRSALDIARDEWCTCSACQGNAEIARQKNRPRFGLPAGDVIFIVTGVLLVLATARVWTAHRNAEPPFDPFAILGVSESASRHEITKAYRKLTLQYHPDKNRNDPRAGEKFIRISKAFSALTDEVAKENYRKYGNPDGYIGTSLGVGLPSWMEQNSSIMITVYLISLLAFPIVVGIWWHRQAEVLSSSICTHTTQVYFETIAHTGRFYDLLACVAGSQEFAPLYDPTAEDLVVDLATSVKKVRPDAVPRVVCSQSHPLPYQIQNFHLLCAYLCRLKMSPRLRRIVDSMLTRMEAFLTALVDTGGMLNRPDCQAAWGHFRMAGNSVLFMNCIHLMQCMFQAVDRKDSPLMQIPGFTEREVRYCVGSRLNSSKNVHEFMRLDESVKRDLLRGFSDQQFLDVQAFCIRYPLAMLEVGEPFVEDEEDLTVYAGDNVVLKCKLTVMRRSGSVYSPHVPNLRYKKSEVWWVCLNDQKRSCPIGVKRLLPKDARGHDPDGKIAAKLHSCCGNLSAGDPGENVNDEVDHSDEFAKDPRVTMYDLRFEFMAPRPGTYMLEVTAAPDCYVGCNRSKTVKMEVAEPVKRDIPEVRYFDSDDESGDDEDGSSCSDSDSDEVQPGTDPEDDSYEYIEVTASESDTSAVVEDGHETDSSDDFASEEDRLNGINGVCSGISVGSPTVSNGSGKKTRKHRPRRK